MFIAEGLIENIMANLGWIIAGLIVLVGVALGWQDLLRFNLKRIWAISSVCFRESMRRRVLLVTPLAMLGVIAVSQLSHPSDEQDTIRQTTKYCLFASGIVVVVATLILACTSLPKEIENRVIYTIVTKPTTRLEIVLGKSLGFARTSAAILLVMGIFSYIYLQINAAQLTSAIRSRLAVLPPADQSRDTLQHYVDEGLLQARNYSMPQPATWGKPAGFQVLAREPESTDKFKWVLGSREHDVLFPYEIPEVVFQHPEAHLVFTIQLAVKQSRPLNKKELENQRTDPTATTRATTKPAQTFPGPATIEVSVLGETGFNAVPPKFMMDEIHTQDKQNREPDPYTNGTAVVLDPPTRNGISRARMVVLAKSMQESVARLPATDDGYRRIYLKVTGLSQATYYGFAAESVIVQADLIDSAGKPVRLPLSDFGGKAFPPSFRGQLSNNHNQELAGNPNRNEAAVGIFEFRDKDFAISGDSVPFEFRCKVDRSGEETTETENKTKVEIQVVNHTKNNAHSAPLMLAVDSDRPTFFRLPRGDVEGGNFDLVARVLTEGHIVGLRSGSVIVASSIKSFALNLFKSLLILWMLSILVIVIAVFCSTFVSWPIAVVLSLVLLLGRWCVMQLGDLGSPQQMFSDLFGTSSSPVVSRVFTDTVSGLNKILAVAGKVLPDLDQFRVTEEIERGVNISFKTMYDPLGVLLVFGIPLLILGYVFLRYKEVAP